MLNFAGVTLHYYFFIKFNVYVEMSGPLTPCACTSSVPHEPCSLIKAGKLFHCISSSWLVSFLFQMVLVVEDWAWHIGNFLQYKLLTHCGTEKIKYSGFVRTASHLICFLMTQVVKVLIQWANQNSKQNVDRGHGREIFNPLSALCGTGGNVMTSSQDSGFDWWKWEWLCIMYHHSYCVVFETKKLPWGKRKATLNTSVHYLIYICHDQPTTSAALRNTSKM